MSNLLAWLVDLLTGYIKTKLIKYQEIHFGTVLALKSTKRQHEIKIGSIFLMHGPGLIEQI